MSDRALDAGITPAGTGQVVWKILGHTYWLKAWCTDTFAFESLDPPGTFVPPHVHPDQDEFIYVLAGTLDLQLGEGRHRASVGDLVRMPRGVPHAVYNNDATEPARALFWVSPAGRLKELFDALHEQTDPDEVVRLAAIHGIRFLGPEPEAE